jgi:uncharacterized RDD family membrane protein YckC
VLFAAVPGSPSGPDIQMKPKFEPDVDPEVKLPPATRLIDPDAYDASEQRFAASIAEKPAPPRFVVDAVPEASMSLEESSPQVEGDECASGLSATPAPQEVSGLALEEKPETVAPNASLAADFLQPPDSGSWRGEVTARVNNYRARRRPREPRYPSLQLKFDPPPSVWTSPAVPSQHVTAAASGQLAVAVQEPLSASGEAQPIPPRTNDAPHPLNVADAGARILEFPRSTAAPAPGLDELAEPVMDRPRILEVPELLLPPPALGGILIEPVEEPAKERRPGFELPLQAAPMSRRLMAGAIDSLLVIFAFSLFAYMFFRVTSIVPDLQPAAGVSVCLIALFWAAYQYLLLVYAGTTPGLKLARLQLSRFDGAAVPRRIRRWRVFASILSGLSLTLGYAWCFMDEDQLCWHDRITRTYMAPQTPKMEDSISN